MDAATDSTALALAVTTGFLLFASGFWLIVSLGQWALAPIDRPAVSLRFSTQFSLREFMYVALQSQLLLAAALWWCGDQPDWAISAIGVIGVGLIVAWWQGVQRLSRCGVTCQLRRSVFLLITTPLTCATIAAALWINGSAVFDICLGRDWPLLPWLIANFVMIVAFGACRLLTVWAMHDVTAANPAKLPADGIQYVSPLREEG